jgi:hypothetical protein
MGVVLAGLAARHLDDAFNLTTAAGAFGRSGVVSLLCYVLLLALPLYLVARRVQRSVG